MGSYNGTVPTFLAGELPDADKLTEISNFMTASTSAWTTYTPTWTGSGSNPAIVNGQLLGRYRRLGKTVDVKISVAMGSSTTYGTGFWIFTPPVAVSSLPAEGGVCAMFDGSASTRYLGSTGFFSGNIFIAHTSGNVGTTVPFTWANTDTLFLSLTYEAA